MKALVGTFNKEKVVYTAIRIVYLTLLGSILQGFKMRLNLNFLTTQNPTIRATIMTDDLVLSIQHHNFLNIT